MKGKERKRQRTWEKMIENRGNEKKKAEKMSETGKKRMNMETTDEKGILDENVEIDQSGKLMEMGKDG